MPKFRKKPVIIDAFQWTLTGTVPEWFYKASISGEIEIVIESTISFLRIRTWEGIMIAMPHDFIIKGIKGEIYPCKPDIFEATYEPVEEPEL